MPKTNTYNSKVAHLKSESLHLTNATFELVKWPVIPSYQLTDKVFSLQTTRLPYQQNSNVSLNKDVSTSFTLKNEKSSYSSFNLGLHVGDSAERVIANRNVLKQFIRQQLAIKEVSPGTKIIEELKIQWLEQVHGNKVVTVTCVDEKPVVADASITRQMNTALAIMTADCLPILLSHKKGVEIAAIHGGWRPLVANIIAETIDKMHSKPEDIVAWLGPCIGKDTFEVGSEVKQAFTQLDSGFNKAFVEQDDGKYLADLHQIARQQLEYLGVTVISALEECTYQKTKKYYSYRKEQTTGRMASIICRR